MLLIRKNLKGGPTLKGYPLCEDPKTSCLGYKLGYCEGCNEEILIRTVDVRDVIGYFGIEPNTKREPIKHKIIRLLGGRVGD